MIRLSGTPPSCTKLLTYCLCLLFVLLLISLFFNLQLHHTSVVKTLHTARSTPLSLHDQQSNSLSKFVSSAVIHRSLDRKKSCLFHTCFNISCCTLNAYDRVTVYVYPKMQYKFTFSSNNTLAYDPPLSWEYEEVVNTIINSEYYEPNASRACLFVPYLDLLNQRTINTSLTSAIFQKLQFWNSGQNHVIFSMLSGTYPHFNSTPDVLYDCAMIAGGSLHITTYRRGFDVAIPVYNSLTHTSKYRYTAANSPRHHLLTVLIQPGSDSDMVATLIKLASNEEHADNSKHTLKMLSYCLKNPSPGLRCTVGQKRMKQHSYPAVLQDSVFCLLVPGFRLGKPDLLDAMMMGCIPVLVKTGHVLPFSEVLDWSRAAIMVWEEELPRLMTILSTISERVQEQMRDHIIYLYWRFFSSISSIILTTLDILNSRIYPLSSHNSYEWWNNQPFNPSNTKYFQYSYPYGLDLPAPPPNQGFTAVIYSSGDNIPSLFSTVQSVARAPSLAQLVVLWCSSDPPPPALVERSLPNITKPIKFISMENHKLSKRFFPYKEIETAAILSLDDDVSTLTVDEIEFGYKAWLENPKQLVGYTGRTHWYSEHKMQWYYSNDLRDNISIVLVGAAYYHSFYNYLYTHHLTPNIRHYMDDHVYCMDIGFNIMMANFTGLPPVKVTPRNHFPCTSCQHKTVDSQYCSLRDQCLNQLGVLFYNMPLKTASYRLDPVLYKVDTVKEQFKSYANMAEL